jgi:hypothetical protein
MVLSLTKKRKGINLILLNNTKKKQKGRQNMLWANNCLVYEIKRIFPEISDGEEKPALFSDVEIQFTIFYMDEGFRSLGEENEVRIHKEFKTSVVDKKTPFKQAYYVGSAFHPQWDIKHTHSIFLRGTNTSYDKTTSCTGFVVSPDQINISHKILNEWSKNRDAWETF